MRAARINYRAGSTRGGGSLASSSNPRLRPLWSSDVWFDIAVYAVILAHGAWPGIGACFEMEITLRIIGTLGAAVSLDRFNLISLAPAEACLRMGNI